MESKFTDFLKVLQGANGKEPAKMEEPVASVVVEEHGGSVEEEQHEFRTQEVVKLVDNPIGVHAINPE